MRLLVALTILWALGAALAAAEPFDRLFATLGITELPDGDALIYRHRAKGIRAGGQEASERAIRLERHTNKGSVVATVEGDGARQVASFRGAAGNPIVLVFLDGVVRRVSEGSGASPFYLRNRIREALQERRVERPIGAGPGHSAAPATEVVLRPFQGDAHAEQLGVFATLALSFILSDAAPGGFVSLRATAGEGTGAYSEEILLDDTL